MARAAIVFAALTVSTAPVWGKRRNSQESDLSVSFQNKLTGAPFFWRPKGNRPGIERLCQLGGGGETCEDNQVKKPVSSKEDCEAAFGTLTYDKKKLADSDSFQVKSVSVVSPNKDVQSIGNRRGCIIRKRNNNKDDLILTWVEKAEDEYYGSDVCGCYPPEIKETVAPQATASEAIKARIKDLEVEMTGKFNGDLQGARVTLKKTDEETGEVVKETDVEVVGEDLQTGDVIVAEPAGSEQRVKVEMLVTKKIGEMSAAEEEIYSAQVAANCACYAESAVKTECCLFGQVPALRKAINKNDVDHFYSARGKVDVEHGCKDKDSGLVVTGCVTKCTKQPPSTDRSSCTAPCFDPEGKLPKGETCVIPP